MERCLLCWRWYALCSEGLLYSRRGAMSNEKSEKRFSTEIERSAELAVVKCRGELVSSTTHLLYDDANPLLSEHKRVVLDLKELTHIDSMGIGSLVRLYVSAKSKGSSLQLANVGGRVKQVLGISHLLSVFEAAEQHNIPLHRLGNSPRRGNRVPWRHRAPAASVGPV